MPLVFIQNIHKVHSILEPQLVHYVIVLSFNYLKAKVMLSIQLVDVTTGCLDNVRNAVLMVYCYPDRSLRMQQQLHNDLLAFKHQSNLRLRR